MKTPLSFLKTTFLSLFFLLFATAGFGQTVNGTIGAGEYGTHTDGSNQQTTGGTITYMNFDATNLYVGVSGANLTEGIVIYLDTNPIAPINGGTNSNGTLVGQNYDGSNFAELPFRADAVLYVKNGYREYRTANGSNGWSAPTLGFGSYADNSPGTVREFSIPWSSIGGTPTSFNFFTYEVSSGGSVYGQTPTQNAGGTIGTSARYERYYTVSTSSVKPFSRNSFVFNNTVDENAVGLLNVYDLTMTKNFYLSRTGGTAGTWTVAGNLLQTNGNIYLGSGGNDLDLAGNLNIQGGTFNFGVVTNASTVTGNVNVSSGATLIQSSAFGGDLKVKGNFINDGTLTPNSRAVFFTGTAAQNLKSANALDYVIVNNTGGINLTNSVTFSKGLTLTSGSINLGTNNLTVPGSFAIVTPSVSSHIIANSTGKLIRTAVGSTNRIFPVGYSAAKYSPITLNNTTGTSDLSVNLSNTLSGPVNDINKVVQLQWNVTSSAATTATVSPTWEAADQGASMTNPGLGEIGNYQAPVYVTKSAALTPYSTSASGFGLVSGLNRFVVGNVGTISPTLSTNGTTSLAFGSAQVGTFTASQSFNLSGNLFTPAAGNITVNAPTHFQVSLNNITFSSSVSVPYMALTLASTPIYVRFAPTSTCAKAGNITFSGGGVSSPPQVAVSGTGTLPTPVATAATNVTDNSFDANWNAVSGATSYEIDVYNTTVLPNATDLFISEYVEGTSNNKYLEIFNGTGGPINIQDYDLVIYANGSATVTATLALPNYSLANNSTYVIRNNSSSLHSANLSTTSDVLKFDGNDALALRKSSSNIDVIGVIGDSSVFAADVTLVRKEAVNSPTTTYNASNWDSLPTDFVFLLGSHSFTSGTITTNVYTSFNVGNVTTFNVTGLTENTKYNFVVRAVNGACPSADSNIIEVTTDVGTTTWDGTSWSNGIPTVNKKAIINGAYDMVIDALPSITAFRLTVNDILVVKAGNFVSIKNELLGSALGDITIESDGNFVQTAVSSTNNYLGTFKVKRNASMKRLDYTYWGSPVSGQLLKPFSPNTVNSRFNIYDESDDKFYAVADPSVTAFESGKGYAIRAPNNYTGTKATFEGVFTGSPNNGVITFIMKKDGQGYNLVGNPYASNIDFNKLYEDGAIEGTAYFWTNVNDNPAQGGSGYSGDNYSTYTYASGGVAATNGDSSKIPDQFIKVGQGFIVEAIAAGNLNFSNTMRDNGTGASKFINKNAKDNPNVIDRFWLKLTTPTQNFNTILIAYPKGATNGFEKFADAEHLSDSSDNFYSILNAHKLNIQGRAYPLQTTDLVPLGFKGYDSGNYTIEMVKKEGIFAVDQDIFLKDKQTGTITNISENSYAFTANAGITEGRFEIIYENQIILGTNATQKEAIVVYRDGNDFVVKSDTKNIAAVEIYDTSGRLMLIQKSNDKVVRLDGNQLTSGMYFLKINQEGKVITKKILK